jgi:tetratricopeptide (TPR) repeat protein
MEERPGYFDLNSTQDFYTEGRIEYARRLYDEGVAAIKAKNLKAALTKLRISARAFPFPTTLRQIGECLLHQGKPADAVLYLAAAVGMTPYGMHAKPLLLLIKALLRAREKGHALLRCQELAVLYPDMKEALSDNPEDAVEELLKRLAQQSPPSVG